ncbi:MAG: hypothetical protein HOI47_25090 [Candidatus Scalindua sp.]|mgnify:FL=1|jgi:hypothetical protein|nr:hypothetical protein [Candidatus Scalindua sp.]
MPSYQFSKCVDDGLKDMIVVTGIFRSGTTITGKIIGSFKGVEYAYDPPLLFYANALMRRDSSKKENMMNWIKVYLYYDYYLNYLQGRYNFRSKDEGSCVLHMKPYSEVMEKWFSSGNAFETINRSSNKDIRFSFKFCNLYDLLESFVDEFSGIRIIDITRDLNRVLVSVIAKKWFFRERLTDDAAVLWPFRVCENEIRVPYLVDESDVDFWCNANDITRSVYICCKLAENKIKFRNSLVMNDKKKEKYLEIRYEDLVTNPSMVVKKVSRFTNTEWGKLTDSIINDIRPTKVEYSIENAQKQCNPVIFDRFGELNKKLGY